jgi:hypothetical protein
MGIIKIVWILSLAGFLAVTLFVYATLPAEVTITADASGYPDLFLARANFFYLAVGLVVLFNAAILVLGRAVQFLPSYLLPVPQRAYWGQRENRPRLHKRFKHWVKGLGLCANAFMTVAVVEVQKYNGQEMTVNLGFLYIVAFGALVLWAASYYPIFAIWTKKLE